jgi:hypothetical protein
MSSNRGSGGRRPGWARLNYPDEFKLGLEQLAQRCGWRLRTDDEGTWATTLERYERVRPALFRLSKVADVTNAGDPRQYHPLNEWRRQDQYATFGKDLDVKQFDWFKEPQTPEDFWLRFRLGFLMLSDAEIAPFSQAVYEHIAAQHPASSLWTITYTDSLVWCWQPSRRGCSE